MFNIDEGVVALITQLMAYKIERTFRENVIAMFPEILKSLFSLPIALLFQISQNEIEELIKIYVCEN